MKQNKCHYCGTTGKVQRYRPDDLNGRWVLACDDCINEARFGKYGWNNKRWKPDKDASYFKGRTVVNG